MLAGFKLMKVEHPLFCCEAIDEFKVRFPVLYAVLPLHMGMLECKGVVGNAVLL